VEINDFRNSSSGKRQQCGKLEISGDYLFEVGITAVIVMSLSAPVLQKEQVKADRKQTEQGNLESRE
jgi:hypothetical protein